MQKRGRFGTVYVMDDVVVHSSSIGDVETNFDEASRVWFNKTSRIGIQSSLYSVFQRLQVFATMRKHERDAILKAFDT